MTRNSLIFKLTHLLFSNNLELSLLFASHCFSLLQSYLLQFIIEKTLVILFNSFNIIYMQLMRNQLILLYICFGLFYTWIYYYIILLCLGFLGKSYAYIWFTANLNYCKLLNHLVRLE